jgi:hypothetical protein
VPTAGQPTGRNPRLVCDKSCFFNSHIHHFDGMPAEELAQVPLLYNSHFIDIINCKVMKHIFLPVMLVLSMAQVNGQAGIDVLSDEFNDSTTLQQWSLFHKIEEFPDKVKQLQVNRLQNGLLELVPKASGWYADFQAPFLFKMVTGDFDVRARVKVSGSGNKLPSVDWSLAGLMVRQPKRTRQNNWEPRQENWLFITTGVADDVNLPVFEVKTTSNSISNLKLRPAKSGWVELRIVRIDAAFIMLARYEGKPWEVLERFYRPVMMGPLQVGLNAYSSWNGIPASLKKAPKLYNETVADAPADLVLQVDYIRFGRPVFDATKLQGAYNRDYARTLFYTPGNLLSDHSISNQDILSLIGN